MENTNHAWYSVDISFLKGTVDFSLVNKCKFVLSWLNEFCHDANMFVISFLVGKWNEAPKSEPDASVCAFSQDKERGQIIT
jgi:hypothetical protein